MADYHVKCSSNGRIHAGTLNKKQDKWINSSDVTEEALVAVRDHLLSMVQGENQMTGFQWPMSDGHSLLLELSIIDTPQENAPERVEADGSAENEVD